MALRAAVGLSQAVSGAEAGAQAARQALDGQGRRPAALGWVIASRHYPLAAVLAGVASALGETPLVGFSSPGVLTAGGLSRRAVGVALLAGDDLQARSGWWPGFGQDSRACTHNMLQSLSVSGAPPGLLWIMAGGLSGDPAALAGGLRDRQPRLAGGLAAGELLSGRTFQIGGRQAGENGLAAAFLCGRLAVGIGARHGWQPTGVRLRVTRVRGPWIRALDGLPPTQVYAHWFGRTAQEWSLPPLNNLVRLYPLGAEEPDLPQGPTCRAVFSPIQMELDGSLRMSQRVREGQVVQLLAADRKTCLAAAGQAAVEARELLGAARPVLGVLLADIAWGRLLESDPGGEIQAIRAALDPQIPLLGGYTLGQIGENQGQPGLRALSQHLQVLLFG